jgi:O-antigen ligase
MGVAAPRPLPLGRSRDWVDVARDAALMAFFVALACSISLSQGLLACLCALVLAPPLFARPGVADAGIAERPTSDPWSNLDGLRRHPLAPPFLAFTGLTLLSAAFSGNPGWSFWIARDLLRIATFGIVLLCTHDSRHAARLWQAFLAALTLMAAYGLSQAYLCATRPAVLPATWMSEICTHAQRVRGPFSIYMTFGGVLFLGVLFFLAYLANVPWRRAWWMLPSAAVTVAALAFTYSRNAWLGLAAGALGLVLTARRTLPIFAVVAAVLVVGAMAMPGQIAERARSVVNLEDQTLRDRVAMWRAGLSMVAEHPLLGVGPGEVRTWYQHYRRPEAIRQSTGHLHNSPIQVAAERGLPALGAWLWFWIVFFREGWRILGRVGRESPVRRALVCASLAGVAGFLVAGLFEHNFGDAEVVMVVYALMAQPWIVSRELAATSPTRLHPAPKPDTPPSPFRSADRRGDRGGLHLGVAESIRDRQAPVPTKCARRDLHARRRLSALVLIPVYHADDLPDGRLVVPESDDVPQ